MVDLFKEIDFSDQNPKLLEFIKKASDEISSSLTSDQINKPYCDTSFSNLILGKNYYYYYYFSHSLILIKLSNQSACLQ